MTVLKQRQRISRVRRVQHDLAALAAAQASGRVQQLEISDGRLAQMREGLGAWPGATSGAALAGTGELALRLENARQMLGDSIAGARAAAALRENARMGARRQQEGAEKLERKAAADAAAAEELRSARLPWRMRTRNEGD